MHEKGHQLLKSSFSGLLQTNLPLLLLKLQALQAHASQFILQMPQNRRISNCETTFSVGQPKFLHNLQACFLPPKWILESQLKRIAQSKQTVTHHIGLSTKINFLALVTGKNTNPTM
uniref:Uncharacterized protein n=1 Tax=Spongospora subterranea TaxID=70186 RepID=A0A0H5QPJ5_9EUKA|eukprot:CRZ03522.1 hypothetical protein [Spongospora subterranea]